MRNKKYYLLYGLILSGLIVFIIILEFIDSELKYIIIKEGGFVESLSAIGYFACVIVLIFYLWKKKEGSKSYWHIIFVLVVFGCRELDFNARFTTMSLTKIKLYLSPDVPVIEKIIGIIIMSLLLHSVIYLIKNHFKNLMRAIKRAEPCAVGIFFGILLLFLTKTLDGFGRKLAGIGIAIGNDIELIAVSMEEVLELGIPFMFMIAIVAHFHALTPLDAHKKNQ